MSEHILHRGHARNAKGRNKYSDGGIWTTELTEEIIRMCRERLSAGQIAKALHMTRNQVIGKLNRLGFKLNSRARKPPSIPEPSPSEIETLNVPLSQMPDRGACKFIEFEPIYDALCCGLPVAVSGASYCRGHMRVCYQPMKSKPPAVTVEA
jgi:hypothetical protein